MTSDAGKRLQDALHKHKHAPWYLGGSQAAELGYIAAIEAEAVAAALQAVWDIGDELDSNHTRWAAMTVAERMGVTIRAHNDFSEPPRNRNEEQIAERDATIARLRKTLTVEQARRAAAAVLAAIAAGGEG